MDRVIMERVTVILLLLLLPALHPATAGEVPHKVCPRGWLTTTFACLKYFSQMKRFCDAERYCNTHMPSAHLVTVGSADQNRIISEEFPGSFWIGLHRVKKKDFSWTSASQASYRNWHSTIIEKDIDYETKQCSSAMKNGKWGIARCSSTLPFVCSAPRDFEDCFNHPCEEGLFCQDGLNTNNPQTLSNGLPINRAEYMIHSITDIVEPANKKKPLSREQFKSGSLVLSKVAAMVTNDTEISMGVFRLINRISASVPTASPETEKADILETLGTFGASERILETAQRVAESLATPNGTTVVGTNILLSAIQLDNLVPERIGNITKHAADRTRTERIYFAVSDNFTGVTIERGFTNSTPRGTAGNSISIPLSTFREASTSSLVATSLYYFNDDLFQAAPSENNGCNRDKAGFRGTIISGIISGTVTGHNGEVSLRTDEPAVVSLKLIKNVSSDVVERQYCCVFWNNSRWDTRGCHLVSRTDDGAICRCTHLTSFAVLLTYRVRLTEPAGSSRTETILTLVGCSLSIFGFTATIISIIVSGDIRKKKRPQAKVHVCLFATLAATFLLFIFGTEATHHPTLCFAIAATLHYALLSSFAWMTVEAYTIFKSIVEVLEPLPSAFLRRAMAYSWGFPLIPMIVSTSLMREDYRRPNLCWITSLPLIYAFSTFVGAAILFNSSIFGVAIYKLFGSSKNRRATKTSKMARSDHIKNILSSTFLYVLLGTTWILGYFSVLDQKVRLVQYLFITLNTTQGFTVFLLYIITNPRARKMWGTILSEKFFTLSSSSVPPPEEVYRKQ